jgi:hypothetical protein
MAPTPNATASAQISVSVPGGNLATITITGAKGGPASSFTIDRITVQ